MLRAECKFDPTDIKLGCVLEHVLELRGPEEEALKRVDGETLTENLSLFSKTGHVTLTTQSKSKLYSVTKTIGIRVR